MAERKKICLYCSSEFITESPSAKYCSEQCARAYERDRRVKSGQARKRTSLKPSTKQYMKIVSDYGNKCCICGWSLMDYIPGKSNGCDLHHIVEVSNGGTNENDNLILLCPNCHKLAHKGFYTKDFLRKKIPNEDEINNMRLERLENVLEGLERLFNNG